MLGAVENSYWCRGLARVDILAIEGTFLLVFLSQVWRCHDNQSIDFPAILGEFFF